MADWLVRHGGKPPIGPVSTELLCGGIESGRVPFEAEACRVGSQDWLPLETYEEFSDALQSDQASTRVSDSPWFLDGGLKSASGASPALNAYDAFDDDVATRVAPPPVSDRSGGPRPAAGTPALRPLAAPPAPRPAAGAPAPPARAKPQSLLPPPPGRPLATPASSRPPGPPSIPPPPFAARPPPSSGNRGLLSAPGTLAARVPTAPFGAALPPPPSRAPSAPMPGSPKPRPAVASEAYDEDDDAMTRVANAPSDAVVDARRALTAPLQVRRATPSPLGAFPPPAAQRTPLPEAPVVIREPAPAALPKPPALGLPPAAPAFGSRQPYASQQYPPEQAAPLMYSGPAPPAGLDVMSKALIGLIIALAIGLIIVLFLLARR